MSVTIHKALTECRDAANITVKEKMTVSLCKGSDFLNVLLPLRLPLFAVSLTQICIRVRAQSNLKRLLVHHLEPTVHAPIATDM